MLSLLNYETQHIIWYVHIIFIKTNIYNAFNTLYDEKNILSSRFSLRLNTSNYA